MVEDVTAPAAGLLHTVPALVATFDDLVRAGAAGLRRIHVVDGWLLETARRQGITPAVQEAVVAHVRQLEALGAGAVLVTCSSIGEAAEEAATAVGVPVIRVDVAMADQAAAIATAPGVRARIAVLGTLSSTLGPTGRLVERAAHSGCGSRAEGNSGCGSRAEGNSGCGSRAEGSRAGGSRAGGSGPRRPVEVYAEVVAGAAEAADRGDREGADRLVAAAVVRAAAGADAVVLAQASMARAAALVDVAVPVLSSPSGGVASLLRAIARPEPAPA